MKLTKAEHNEPLPSLKSSVRRTLPVDVLGLAGAKVANLKRLALEGTLLHESRSRDALSSLAALLLPLVAAIALLESTARSDDQSVMHVTGTPSKVADVTGWRDLVFGMSPQDALKAHRGLVRNAAMGINTEDSWWNESLEMDASPNLTKTVPAQSLSFPVLMDLTVVFHKNALSSISLAPSKQQYSESKICDYIDYWITAEALAKYGENRDIMTIHSGNPVLTRAITTWYFRSGTVVLTRPVIYNPVTATHNCDGSTIGYGARETSTAF